MYLTVLGTCADGADCGQVGRGNGVNGVISLNRPKTSEAAAGKQPVCHPGKVYNVLTHQLADRIHTQVAGVREVYVWLCSQIGKPIDQPLITSIQITLERGIALRSVSPQIREIVDRELENMDKFIQDLARGKFAVC
jgi:S-adenosylmethionine synthetase